jgi:SAM-dependent methyltransferase
VINRFKVFLAQFRLARWLVNLKNGTLHMLRHGYQPRRFWDEWSERFARQAYQRELHASNLWLLDRLRETRPAEVMEIGCGFGRNLRMLRDQLGFHCRLMGSDLSLNLLSKARDEGLAVPLVCADVTRLPFADKAFETVFTHGVLMHVPPDHVRSALQELLRVTRKTLWCIEEHVAVPSARGRSLSINEYTFAHDYPALFDELGVRLSRADYQGDVVALILMRVDLA